MSNRDEKENIFPINMTYKGIPAVVLGDIEKIPKDELINGAVYVFKDKIWRYSSKPERRASRYPIIYFEKDGSIATMESIFKETVTLESVVNGRLNIICKNTDENADFNNDIEDSIPQSPNSIYMPQIKEKDDFLKKMIKTIFHIKKVPTSKYKKKLSKAYGFSNLIQGLNNETKISTTVWQTWIELLGIDCVIILKDSGSDREDPINDYVVYKSRNDTITIVEKDKISDFLSENL